MKLKKYKLISISFINLCYFISYKQNKKTKTLFKYNVYPYVFKKKSSFNLTTLLILKISIKYVLFWYILFIYLKKTKYASKTNIILIKFQKN